MILTVSLFLLTTTTHAQTITPIPSSGTYILSTSSTNLLTAQSGGIVAISSDIPLTVSRYNDDRYVDGEQPVFPTDAVVIITSDCDTDSTSVNPSIVWDYSTGGSVAVSLNGASSPASFLSPASYEAEWEWLNWGCDVYPTPAPFPSSAFSLGPTEAGQVVKVMSDTGETQTLDEYRAEQNAEKQSSERSSSEDSQPFNEEEYTSTSGVAGRSTALLLGVAMMALAVPRDDRWGKFVAVALALSSFLPKRRQIPRQQSQSRSATVHRTLQTTCTFNAEILLDGCTHPLVLSAPKTRIVDALVSNSNSQKGSDNPCLYQYTADITFPVTDDTVTYTEEDVEVDALSYNECIRPTDGRPFVDSSGALLARPLVKDGGCDGGRDSTDWTSGSSSYCVVGRNDTHRLLLPLGEEWTRRALGEHASIASFSAFSIALLTNSAPSTLVREALVAGLDEIRHARASFEIASRLMGREVGPGPLPESALEFGRDLSKLGLAVAREGCVDETLSAIAAAVESLELSGTRKDGKYADLDAVTAAWIRDELNTIAMEESAHSALAWRTLFWVCNVDVEACDLVKKEVFEESQLEMRFNYRFAKSFAKKPELLEDMKRAWRKVYERLASLSLDNLEVDYGKLCDKTRQLDSDNILSELTDNILRGVLCAQDPNDADRIAM